MNFDKGFDYIHKLRKNGEDILVSLDEIQDYINWYEDCQHPTSWDDKKYQFCKEVMDNCK